MRALLTEAWVALNRYRDDVERVRAVQGVVVSVLLVLRIVNDPLRSHCVSVCARVCMGRWMCCAVLCVRARGRMRVRGSTKRATNHRRDTRTNGNERRRRNRDYTSEMQLGQHGIQIEYYGNPLLLERNGWVQGARGGKGPQLVGAAWPARDANGLPRKSMHFNKK